MKYNLCITTITFLIATMPCFGMEKKTSITQNKYPTYHKPTILFEIPLTKYEYHAQFVDDNHIIINGSSNCRKIRLGNNTPLFTIKNSGYHTTFAIHRDKTCFATSDYKKITVYDAATGIQKATTPLTFDDMNESILFNSNNNTIVYWQKPRFINATANKLIQYDYNNQKTSSILPCYVSSCLAIDTHPTEPHLVLENVLYQTKNLFIKKTAISFHHYDEKTERYEHKNTFYSNNDLLRLIYSPNGSCVAAAATNCITIILHNNFYYIFTLSLLEEATKKRFETIEFHPNNKILAALLLIPNTENPKGKKDYSAIIQYFDLCAADDMTPIAETSLADLSPLCKYDDNEKILSFSPCGTKLMIRLRDKLIVIPVSFEAIYKAKEKEKAMLVLQAFKKLSIPNDIIQLCMYNLLQWYKR